MYVIETSSENDIDVPIILSLFRLINIVALDEKGKRLVGAKKQNLHNITNTLCTWQDNSTEEIKIQAKRLEDTINAL